MPCILIFQLCVCVCCWCPFFPHLNHWPSGTFWMSTVSSESRWLHQEKTHSTFSTDDLKRSLSPWDEASWGTHEKRSRVMYLSTFIRKYSRDKTVGFTHTHAHTDCTLSIDQLLPLNDNSACKDEGYFVCLSIFWSLSRCCSVVISALCLQNGMW